MYMVTDSQQPFPEQCHCASSRACSFCTTAASALPRIFDSLRANNRQQTDLNIAQRRKSRPGGKIRPKSKWDALVGVACHVIELFVIRSFVHPILGGGVLHKRQILGANEAAQPPECVVSCAATPARQPGDSSLVIAVLCADCRNKGAARTRVVDPLALLRVRIPRLRPLGPVAETGVCEHTASCSDRNFLQLWAT